jgi:hypothetical protein
MPKSFVVMQYLGFCRTKPPIDVTAVGGMVQAIEGQPILTLKHRVKKPNNSRIELELR